MNPQTLLQMATAELDRRYPVDTEYDFLVSEERQNEEVENLKKTVRYEQFFFVVNLPKRKLEHINGLQDWLGYADHQFTMMDYFSIIHPSQLAALNLSAQSSFDIANSGKFELKFMNHRVVVQVPLRHSDGRYLLTKRTLYPFQIDQKTGMVTSYLNHFVILKEFHELDTLDMRVSNEGSVRPIEEQSEVFDVRTGRSKGYSLMTPFNNKEIEILQLIAEQPQITHKEIAETLNLNYDTLRKTTNSRMIAKAREYFNIAAFDNLKEIALYMKKEGLLS